MKSVMFGGVSDESEHGTREGNVVRSRYAVWKWDARRQESNKLSPRGEGPAHARSRPRWEPTRDNVSPKGKLEYFQRIT